MERKVERGKRTQRRRSKETGREVRAGRKGGEEEEGIGGRARKGMKGKQTLFGCCGSYPSPRPPLPRVQATRRRSQTEEVRESIIFYVCEKMCIYMTGLVGGWEEGRKREDAAVARAR